MPSEPTHLQSGSAVQVPDAAMVEHVRRHSWLVLSQMQSPSALHVAWLGYCSLHVVRHVELTYMHAVAYWQQSVPVN